MHKNVNLKAIRIDGGTQSRVSLNQDAVDDYAAALDDSKELPPIKLFFDGTDNWLADGFHRYFAYQKRERASIPADVIEGTQRDAIFYSFSANEPNGLRPSNEDKRKSVAAMLADPEWSKMSDRAIAAKAGCAHPLVGQMRNPKPATPPAPKPPKAAPTPPATGGTPAGDDGSSTTATPPEAGAAPAPTPPEGGSSSTEGTPTEPTGPTDAEKIAEAAHGGSDLAGIIEEQAVELLSLRTQIAAAEADDVKAEAMKWRRLRDIAQTRQNELMQTVKDREDEIKKHVKSLRRIGAAVGEDDPSKVAATVEEFVRNMKVAA